MLKRVPIAGWVNSKRRSSVMLGVERQAVSRSAAAKGSSRLRKTDDPRPTGLLTGQLNLGERQHRRVFEDIVHAGHGRLQGAEGAIFHLRAVLVEHLGAVGELA